MERLNFDKSIAFTSELEQLVPGGAHTYSRGRDQFPANSPNGIVRGEGARVWDIDGNCLIDWSMALTSVSLGHAFPEVNEAVIAAVKNGVSFQRPSQIERDAARVWLQTCGDDMVKFARHGSVVTSAAVKLARAYTGRSKVAAAAEHPFFSFDDWFIGSTPCDFGIPDSIKQYTLRFSYDDIESLDALFRSNPDDIACVILEPVKFDSPAPGYLEELQSLCKKQGAVLIFDEMVTGLKLACPGAQSFFGVRGDISTWGKGIGNGFAISALTGKGDIMRLGGLEPEGDRKLFLLSSTHGAESVGFAAMISTVEYIQRENVIPENWRRGELLQARLQEHISLSGLEHHLRVIGYPPLLQIAVEGTEGITAAELSTLLRQEMIARGVLFQSLFVMTPSHGESEISETVTAFAEACKVIRNAVELGSIDGLLTGPPVKPVFRKIL